MAISIAVGARAAETRRRCRVARPPTVVGVTRRRRRRRAGLAVVVVLLALLGGLVVAVVRVLHTTPAAEPGCEVSGNGSSYALDLTQASNAATIASVGARMGLPDHAVTVALATAYQESKLYNLPYGDLDSVGLFQQRPSQGWGARAQLLDPSFAATAFFQHLQKVPGWQTLPVADAAQAVQRSADGSAYARWEPASRLIAQALTGEVPHGVACRYSHAAGTPDGLEAALTAQRGRGTVGVAVPVRTGWGTASWLVAQAAQYGIGSVSFDGQTWTSASGRWSPGKAPATSVVSYALLGPAS
jgi:hypothetical protein